MEKYAFVHIVQHISSNDITLRAIFSEKADVDNIGLAAQLFVDDDTLAKLERLVAALSRHPSIYAVHRYVGNQAQADRGLNKSGLS